MIDLIQDFLSAGGIVLMIILVTTFGMWTLILERVIFFTFVCPKLVEKVVYDWRNKTDHKSWVARKIREARISESSQLFNQFIPLIKTLVALCPLLGLLGTVTGMIAVFDNLSATGAVNARMMAAGISMATIPTMAGMVAALSGLYFGSRLESRAKMEIDKLSDALTFM